MQTLPQPIPADTPIPGVAHSTWAGAADGLRQLSLWRQRLAPGAATPPHSHPCDEVVLCLSGEGEVHSQGRVQRFGPDTTVVLPGGHQHQLFNVGSTPMEILGVFAATPVATLDPDGAPMDLPWRT